MTSNRQLPPDQLLQPGSAADSAADDDGAPQWPALLASWLIEAIRPVRAVHIGVADRALLISMSNGLRRFGAADAHCVTVRTPSVETQASRLRSHQVATELASALAPTLTAFGDDGVTLTDLAKQSPIDLLWVSDPEADGVLPLEDWLDLVSPGATIVLTSSSGEPSPGFSKTTELISTRYHSLSASLGQGGSVTIAQAVAADDGVNLEIFSGSRSTEDDERGSQGLISSALAVWSLEAESAGGLESAPESFVTALRAYRTLTAHLMLELGDANAELVAQAEAARLELASVTNGFLDRLDVLSAKISTSAGRYESQLEQKDRLLEDMEKRMLDYAGRAATAQSVIDDLHGSSSWRLTAPLRFASRMMAKRSRRTQD